MLEFLKKMKLILVDVLLPVVAFVLSLVALYISQEAQDDVARVETVKTEYGMYDDLAKLQLDNPLMAHLLANTPAAYRSENALIASGMLSTASADRLRLMLQERAVAHYIFTDYEETYFLWRQAAGGEQQRHALLEDNLDYFNTLLCGNPRLLWYWSDNGGDLGQQFSQQLLAYYREHVARDCPTNADSQGPFKEGERK